MFPLPTALATRITVLHFYVGYFSLLLMCLRIWNQGSSYLIYWQLGAWFQIFRELEDEGLLC